MATQFFKKRTWLWVLVLLIFIGISYVNVSQQPQEYPPYLSESPSPTGVKAIYTYLADEYASVSEWTHEPSFLAKNDEQQLLIMVEPQYVPPEREMVEYREFVEAGNTILLFSESSVEMFGVTREEQFFFENEEGTIQSEVGEEYTGMISSAIRFQPENEEDVLLSDDLGAKAVKRSLGEGEIIIANSPQWLTNGVILDNDHAALVLSLIDEGWQGQEILFDNYIHGGEPPTVATLYPQWFLIIILQGGLLTLVWLWFKGKRFGPIVVPREESVRFSDEGIKALAAWYLRAKHSRFHESLEIQIDYVKLLMQEQWRIPYDKNWHEIAEQIEKKSTMSKTDIDAFSTGLTNVLHQKIITKKEYVDWSKRIDRLRKEVEER
ncbi:DUF4350 domain-containing protein [Salipaludibacillus sp. HK11]|uniref:DUF4350 domain-containing protein n=1 Tax=Salipaludibacillus sp. HK11 TaxID=3394320 RepID=UPI0039FD7E97